MAYIRRGNYYVTFLYSTLFFAIFLIEAFAVKYEQCLFGIGMVMPEVSASR